MIVLQSCPATVEPPSGAIQPCHIREAIRRYNYRHTVCTQRETYTTFPQLIFFLFFLFMG